MMAIVGVSAGVGVSVGFGNVPFAPGGFTVSIPIDSSVPFTPPSGGGSAPATNVPWTGPTKTAPTYDAGLAPWIAKASDAAQWDQLILNGVMLPGVAKVEVEAENIYEPNTTQGTDGQKNTYKGRKCKKLTATINIVSAADFMAMQQWMRDDSIQMNSSGKSRSPVNIQHPQCTVFGINLVDVVKLKAPSPEAQKVYVFMLDMVEYIVPPPAIAGTASPATSTSASLSQRDAQGNVVSPPPPGDDPDTGGPTP